MPLAVFLPHNGTYLHSVLKHQMHPKVIYIKSRFCIRNRLCFYCPVVPSSEIFGGLWWYFKLKKKQRRIFYECCARSLLDKKGYIKMINILFRMWHITLAPSRRGRLLLEWCFRDVLCQSCFFMCQARQGNQPNTVIALQDYMPTGEEDLPLQKGQKYILIDSSSSDWWALKNNRGWGSYSNFKSICGKIIREQAMRPTLTLLFFFL